MKKLLTILGLIAFTAATAAEAQSGRPCAPRDAVVKRLAEKYGESRRSVGLGHNNSVIEVFASEETGTWTITATMANGMMCLLASGQAFEAMADALPNTDSDA